MSEKKIVERKVFSPFITRIDAPKKSDFDKYYIDRDVKELFKSTGQKDENGNDLGVAIHKIVEKKVDIQELLESQRDSVGVESYMKALAIQGVSGDDFFTNVDLDKVQDFSDMPTDKFEGALYGKKAVQIFDNLDPALKGNHTTIEGFLSSLTQEKIDAFIKGRVEALTPNKKSEGE